MNETTKLTPFDNSRLLNLCGNLNENVHLLEKRLNVEILNRGNLFKIFGNHKDVQLTQKILEYLYIQTKNNSFLTNQQVHLAIQEKTSFYETESKIYMKTPKRKITFKNLNQKKYIDNLNMDDYIGQHHPKHVVVLADSGYDDRKIENAIRNKKWHFIIALNKGRSVKSQNSFLSTPKSKGWSKVAQFFKDHRKVGWQTIRIVMNRSKKSEWNFASD